jgi:hypothetical protein
MVFLDTETTGLSGGAGTLPFLVGVGYLHEGAFVVEQVFLDHPRDEPAMVAHLARTLARFEQAVTYNGRAFDLPLMQNRFVLQRTPWPGLGEMLDLLPGTRRLHRRHLDDRSLGSVERNLLGFAREGDVPGSEIPGIYHRFLLTRRSDGVAEVLRHNLWDVLAMAALIGFQADLLGERRPAGAIDPAVDGVRARDRALGVRPGPSRRRGDRCAAVSGPTLPPAAAARSGGRLLVAGAAPEAGRRRGAPRAGKTPRAPDRGPGGRDPARPRRPGGGGRARGRCGSTAGADRGPRRRIAVQGLKHSGGGAQNVSSA